MNIRQLKEQNEHLIMNKYAVFSDSSKGRMKYEDSCDIRTCFERDRDRIIHALSLIHI